MFCHQFQQQLFDITLSHTLFKFLWWIQLKLSCLVESLQVFRVKINESSFLCRKNKTSLCYNKGGTTLNYSVLVCEQPFKYSVNNNHICYKVSDQCKEGSLSSKQNLLPAHGEDHFVGFANRKENMHNHSAMQTKDAVKIAQHHTDVQSTIYI